MKLRPIIGAVAVLAGLAALGLTPMEAQQAPAARNQKLYVLNSRVDTMSVVDVAANTIVKTFVVGKGPHGLASPRGNALLYVSLEEEGGVTLVDTVRDQVVKKFSGFSLRPQEGDITPDGRFLYQPAYTRMNVGEGIYDVFDTKAERVVAQIPTAGLGHNAVVSPDGRFAYLMPITAGPEVRVLEREHPLDGGRKWEFKNAVPTDVYVVDTSSQKIVGTIPVGNSTRPTAISPDGKRLYVQTDNLMGFVVVDLEARKVLSKAVYDLTPEELATRSRSHGIAVAADGREVWSTDVNNNLVFAFDVTVTPPKQIARFKTERQPLWATAAPDGKTVYVSSPSSDLVVAYDVVAKTEKARIQFEKGLQPKRIIALEPPRQAPASTTTAAR